MGILRVGQRGISGTSILSVGAPGVQVSGGGGPSFVGALDAWAGLLTGVYAPMRLLTSYTGPLARVQRAADSNTLDVGYDDDGFIDIAAINTFVGSDTALAYIRPYNQIDGALATQATKTAQPKLVRNGILSMAVDGVDDYLDTGITPTNDQAYSAIIKFADLFGNNGIVFGAFNVTPSRGFLLQPRNGGVRYWNGTATLTVGSVASEGTFAVAGNKGYRNGVAESGTITGYGGNTIARTIYAGALNQTGSAADFASCNIKALVLANSALDASTVDAITDALDGLPAYGAVDTSQATKLVVCEGDSMTAGVSLEASSSYPAQLQAMLGSDYEVVNIATGGATLNNIAAEAITTDALYNPTKAKNILVIWAGTNDMAGGESGADTYTELVSYCQARQATWDEVIVLTCLPQSVSGIPGDWETQRGIYNSSIVSGLATFADKLANVAADGRIGDAGDELNADYYLSDKIHGKANGYRIVARAVADAILS